MRRTARLMLAGACAAATALAPAADARTPSGVVAASPDSRPVRAVTSFSDALSCMDDLFLQYGKRDIKVITDGLPDQTETLKLGTREMMISALDAMSTKSRAFLFVDFDLSAQNTTKMSEMLAGKTATADFYIKGSITQIDQGVTEDGRRAGLAFSRVSAGLSSDRSASEITMEIGVYKTDTRMLLPGVRTSNTIEVLRKGKGANIEGLLPFASLTYEVHHDQSQGSHQAVRTLLELSMIELMGKFTRVPYWRCLSIPSTDPMARKSADDYFGAMSAQERASAIQSGLTAAGVLDAKDVDRPGSVGAAINRYRVQNGLTPGSNVDFELYYSLLSHDFVSQSATAGGRHRPSPFPAKEESADLALNVQPSASTVRQGERLTLRVTPTQDAYVYCFVNGPIVQGRQTVIRIYPNRFSGQQIVRAGEPLVIPGGGDDFSLQFDDVGREPIACSARTEPFGYPTPDIVQTEDLKPFTGASLAEVVDELQGKDVKGALSSTVRVVNVDVVSRASR